MEDGGLWQVCEAVNNSSLLPQQHTSLFSCMSASSESHATSFGHFESCAAPPLPHMSSPFRSQWGFQYESWMSPARIDEIYDMMTFIAPSTLVDTSAGGAAVFEHAAVIQQPALPGPQAAAAVAVIDLQDLATGAWGHGMINQAVNGTEQHHSIACSGAGGSAEAVVAGSDMRAQQQGMMIDQYFQTLNSSSSSSASSFDNYNLQAVEKMESSLGSVFDKVWNNSNNRTDHQFGVTAAVDSLITNPMGSMFHSISTGSLMYLQKKTCCEAQVMTKPPSLDSLQVSGCTEVFSPADSYSAQEIQKVQKAGTSMMLANSLPDPSLMKSITSAAGAAADDDDDDDASSEVQNTNTVSSVQKLQNGNNHVGSFVPQGLYVSSSTIVKSCETLESSLSAGHQTWFTENSEILSNKISVNSKSKVLVCSEKQQQFSNTFQRTVGQPVITKWLPQIVALPPPAPLEVKRALPAKCALPPLAVVKCALPPLAVVKCALPRSSNGCVTSNAKKRPLWSTNTNMINGSPKKKPIAKWPGVEGCSRLEAVSTLAHHTVTQNTSNARALGPALNTNLKPRARQGSANDPQSIAARVRRERISERLKALQLLVPNGDKVDMVTMLEKAINYVQCLELQIRMLKDDTLWPKALGALPNTLQELLELAGPELAALQQEEQNRKKKRMAQSIEEDDPQSSPTPSSDKTE